MKDRGFLYELRANLIYVKVGENIIVRLSWQVASSNLALNSNHQHKNDMGFGL